MPLPAPELTTVDVVKAFLAIVDNVDDARLAPIVAAVCSVVRSLPIASASDTDPAPADWPDRVKQGATMMAARLWARKDSPEGVASFAADGPVYVQRNDPDVAMLLELGDWSCPAVG